METWSRRRLGKETHPSVLRQVKFSTALVHVKEISEQHPQTFFKIRLASDSDSGNYTGSCSSSTVSSPQLDIRRDHSIFGCDDSTLSTDESIEYWERGSTETLDERGSTETLDEKSSDNKQDGEEIEDAAYEEDDDDLIPEEEEENSGENEVHLQNEKELSPPPPPPQTASKPQPQSFKLKWTFKKRKKKRMRVKPPQRSRKFLFLGDMNCGKSNLITTYCKDRFLEQYHPTILHFCVSDTKVMGQQIDVILADTSGRNDFKPLRQCAYFKTDVAIICYSAEDRSTLDRIRSYWLPELRESAPGCPFLIVETKRDLREEYEDKKSGLERDGMTDSTEYQRICGELRERIVPEGAGLGLARELGAKGFHSTSARYRVGTRKMIQHATTIAVKKSRRRRNL